MVFTAARGEPTISTKEQAVQKLVTTDSSNPITLSAIGIGLLSLATMLGVQLQRGSQPATVLASSAGDNVMEMESNDPNIKCSAAVLETRPARKETSNRVGWGQLSSQNSCPLTFCYAGNGYLDSIAQSDPQAIADVPVPPQAAPEGVDLEALWRAHSKPLLRIGSNGVKPSHRNSLQDLLDAHGHVCVKINGAKNADAVSAAADALAGDGAVVLLTKSNSVLYGKPGRDLSSVRKTKTLQVDPDKIGSIIGKGGETVRGLIADYGLANIDVGDEGAVMITGTDLERMDACAAKIAELTETDLGLRR